MGLFTFLKSKRAWAPPEPRCIFMVACAAPQLPSARELVQPMGDGGTLAGTVGPKPRESLESGFAERPLQTGDSFIIRSTGGAMFLVSVEGEKSVREFPARALIRDAWPYVSLDEDLARRAREARCVVVVMLVERGQNLVRDVLFATRLADRISALGDGCVNDLMSCRFFGSGSWCLQEPEGELDSREHVVVHVETGEPEGPWVHTHGLVKFGRPEFEIYGVPETLAGALRPALLALAKDVITGAVVRPGDNVGAPDAPLIAREGTRHRKGHWEECPVIELVDAADQRGPVIAGARRGVQALLKSRGGR